MVPCVVIDADYFREFFVPYVSEYAEHRGLEQNTSGLQVTVTLANGTEMSVVAWRAGPGWIVFFNEDDQMLTVPYEAIRQVLVHPRPEPLPVPPPRPPVGFTAVGAARAELPGENGS